MTSSRATRSELEEENAMFRARLAEARDLIDETLGLQEVDLDDEDEDDEEEESDGQ